MGIFDLLKLPIQKVASDASGAYGSFGAKPLEVKSIQTTPVTIKAPAMSPLQSLAKPISAVTALPGASGGAKGIPAPRIDTSTPLGFLTAPIVSVTGENGGIQVRKQNFKDVANLPTQIGGFLVGPAIDAFLSLREAVTGKEGHFQIKNPFPEQGALPVDGPAPQWFRDKLEKEQEQSLHPDVVEGTWQDYVEHHNEGLKAGYTSKTSQEHYAEQIDQIGKEALSPAEADKRLKQAFWNTAAKTVLDMSVLVPIAQDAAKFTLLKSAPEKLVESNLVKTTREELRNFASGAAEYQGRSPIPKEVQDAFKAASPEDKIKMLRSTFGVEVITAKPSSIGRLLGVSDEEASQLMERMTGTKGYVRPAPAGVLPGYVRDEGGAPAFGMSTERRKPVGYGDDGRIPKKIVKVDPDTRNYNRKAFDDLLDGIKGNTIPLTHETTLEVAKKILAGASIGHGDDSFATLGHLDKPDFVPDGVRILFEVPKADVTFSAKDQQTLGSKYAIGLDTMDHPSIGDFKGYGGHVAAPLDNKWIVDVVDKDGNSLLHNNADKTVPTGSDLGKELADKYHAVGRASFQPETFSRADETLHHVLSDMELAMPRDVAFIGYGKDARVDMIPSSFPQWVPEDLRSKALFEKVIPDLQNLKYPPARNVRQRALFDAILEEMDSRLGIDTTEIRSRMKGNEKTLQDEAAKTPDRSTQGSTGQEAEKGIKVSEEGIRMSTKGVEARIERRTNRKLEKMAYQAPSYEAFFERSGITQESLDATARKMGAVDARDFYTKVKQDATIAKEMNEMVQKEVAKTLKQMRGTRTYQEKADAEEFGEPELTKKQKQKLWSALSPSEAVQSVEPPRMKNGTRMPVLTDLYSWKDKGPLMLARETLERNIEKVVAPKDRATVKSWFLDPIRKNETARIKFANALRTETEKTIVQGLRIRRKTGAQRLGQRTGRYRKNILTELVQRYGEGTQGEFPITLDELKSMEPHNWHRVKEAAEYFREKYSILLEMVNKQRVSFGYAPIPARPDYFRHFREIDGYITRFGLILKSEDLPGSMTGLTGIFKPGKPFSTAEMKRMGKKTDIDAIAGFDNYIDSITRQIFHIDSVQRGRVFEKYVREAMEASEAAAKSDSDKLILGNFANNLKETTNMVSGKKSDFDRAGEARFGRKIYTSADWLKQRTSANMVGANAASAMTNFAPFAQSLATTEKKAALRGLTETMLLPVKKEPFSIDGVESTFLVRRFPIEKIDPRGLRLAEERAGWIFRGVDQFVSTSIVSGKYYENIGKGMSKEEAMKEADAYAGKVIGDRSAGQVPLFLKDKGLGFITQFQLEVNNVWSFMIHDIPTMSDKNKLKYASMMAQLIVYSYLFNEAYEKVTGRRPILDPIYMALTLIGATPESDQATMPRKIVLAGGNLAGNVPFIGGFTGGRFPAFSVIPDVAGALKGDTTWTKEMAKVPMLLLPFGGLQAKKTYTGIEALIKGYTETTNGDKKALVEPTIGNVIKGTVFGPSALNETLGKNPIVNDLYTRLDTQKAGSASLTAEAEKLDAELLAMKPEEADAKAQETADKNPALFERLQKVVEERQLGLTQEERLIKQLGVKNQERARYVDEMLRRKKPEEADAYLNELIDKKVVTASVLEQLQEIVSTGESAPAVPVGTKMTDDSVISRAVTYAKALGTDPVTAFDRIFTGQRIRYVKNGTVVVERMSVGASEAEAQKQLSATTTAGLARGDVKLDHTVPLELGGSNSKDNLRLVTTAEWQTYTPIENLLGEALRAGTISRTEAQNLIRRFKAGEISSGEVRAHMRQ